MKRSVLQRGNSDRMANRSKNMLTPFQLKFRTSDQIGLRYLRVHKCPTEVRDEKQSSFLKWGLPGDFVVDGQALFTLWALRNRSDHSSINFQLFVQGVNLYAPDFVLHLLRIQSDGHGDVTEEVLRPKRNVFSTNHQQFDVVYGFFGVPLGGNVSHPDGQRFWDDRILELKLKIASLRFRASRWDSLLDDRWIGSPCSDIRFTWLFYIWVSLNRGEEKRNNGIELAGNLPKLGTPKILQDLAPTIHINECKLPSFSRMGSRQPWWL